MGFVARLDAQPTHGVVADAAEVLVCEVDTARGGELRRLWLWFRDRRIDAYQDLLKRYRD